MNATTKCEIGSSSLRLCASPGFSASGTNAVCYTYDANGNVSEMLSALSSELSILAHYEYSPFGETIVATGPMAKENPYRFSTKYTDDETKLVYYGYRFLSPDLGRWVNRDPIKEKGGMNLYVFVFNSPTSQIDILGMYSSFYCHMTLNLDPGLEYSSKASMLCKFDCCRCQEVQFVQVYQMVASYWQFGFYLREDIVSIWQLDHDGKYYDEHYEQKGCYNGSRKHTAIAGMEDSPSIERKLKLPFRLNSFRQVFETKAICTKGKDAGKTYATWNWGHYFTRSSAERWFAPEASIVL